MNDALAYTSIKHNRNIPASYFRSLYVSNDLRAEVGEKAKTDNDLGDLLDDYLSKTTIKRACCLGRAGTTGNQIGIPVKIPIDISGTDDNLQKKLGFITKTIMIPSSMCNPSYLVKGKVTETDNDAWKPGSKQCNIFYETYCKNMLENYTKENKGLYDGAEWQLYYPECACFGIPQKFKGTTVNVPRKCYMPGCDESAAKNKSLYLDYGSINAPGCSQTICTAGFDVNDVKAGEGVTVVNQVTQECGAQATAAEIPEVLPNNANTNVIDSSKGTPTSGNTGGKTSGSVASNGGGTNGTDNKGSNLIDSNKPTEKSTTSTTNTVGINIWDYITGDKKLYGLGGISSCLCCCCILLIIFAMMSRSR